MSLLNKERVVLVLALVVLGYALYAAYSGYQRVGSLDPTFVQPKPSFTVATGDEVSIEWWAFETRGATRDPFVAISEWRRAEADILPLPPLGPLQRRVPLPGPLSSSPVARLPLEAKMPESLDAPEVEEEGNQ